MALFLAQVEIQIEGGAGWATSFTNLAYRATLVVRHFLGRPRDDRITLDVSFIAMVFHLPLFLCSVGVAAGRRAVQHRLCSFGSSRIFVVLLNPAFGFARFNPIDAPWHKY